MRIINYASSLAIHPLIAKHPLYESLLLFKSENYRIQKDVPDSDLTIIPTYYKQINRPHSIVIEDYITLFFPFIHNGSNYLFNKHEPYLYNYRRAFESPNFRGIVTHMKQTIESIKTLFDSDVINEKIYYLPLAYENNKPLKEFSKDKIVITFTNSFGGTQNNFPLRGGLESIMAARNIMERRDNIYLNIVGEVRLPKDIENWALSNKNVTIHSSDCINEGREMYTEDKVNTILADTDIFLIPACRIHSMSVVKGLCYGNVVIGSDGWGFNEFLTEDCMVKGQSESSYIEDNLLKEKYSLALKQPNELLYSSIVDKVEFLLNDLNYLSSIKIFNYISSKEKFSYSKRDSIFEQILKKMLNE